MAVRALPEQFRAPVPAPDADVRVEVEDRPSRDLDVARNEMPRQIQRGQRVPDCLVDREGVRVVLERVEEQLQRLRRLAGGRQVAGERRPRAPFARRRRDQPPAEIGKPVERSRRRIGVLEPVEREIGSIGRQLDGAFPDLDRAAPVTLDRVSVGAITERSVPALIAQPGQLRTSLLGMSFLNRLERWEVRGDRLVMRGYP